MYLFTIYWFLNVSPFVAFNNDTKVDRAVATDEQPTPDLHIIVTNSMIFGEGVETRLISFSL